MPTQSKFEAVKEKIVEACPEIMELSFGCEVSIDGMLKIVLNSHNAKDLTQGCVDCIDKPILNPYQENHKLKLHYKKFIPFKREARIIGHPITLEHVLKAIEYFPHSQNMDCEYQVYGKAIRIYYFEKVARQGKEIDGNWNFCEPLEKQSERTIDFLYNLLCLPN